MATTARKSRQASVEGYILLKGTVEREGRQFVAYCRELGTSSCGDTIEEAFANLDDAINVHLAALLETGELAKFLREHNIRVHVPPRLTEFVTHVPVGKLVYTYQKKVLLRDAA